jgi:3-oxoacyl-[acyl-carrier-protein] synthase-1
MESAFCALGMREGFTPGNAHLTRLEPQCEGINVLRATLPTAPEIVMKNSSGFGGANVALVFKRVAA